MYINSILCNCRCQYVGTEVKLVDAVPETVPGQPRLTVTFTSSLRNCVPVSKASRYTDMSTLVQLDPRTYFSFFLASLFALSSIFLKP